MSAAEVHQGPRPGSGACLSWKGLCLQTSPGWECAAKPLGPWQEGLLNSRGLISPSDSQTPATPGSVEPHPHHGPRIKHQRPSSQGTQPSPERPILPDFRHPPPSSTLGKLVSFSPAPGNSLPLWGQGEGGRHRQAPIISQAGPVLPCRRLEDVHLSVYARTHTHTLCALKLLQTQNPYTIGNALTQQMNTIGNALTCNRCTYKHTITHTLVHS